MVKGIDLKIKNEWIDKGLRFAAKGEYQKAIECFNNALKGTPDDKFILYLLAVSYLNLKEFNTSVKYCEMALQSRKENKKVDFNSWLLLSTIYRSLKNYQKALVSIEKVFKILPDIKQKLPIENHAEAFFIKGLLHLDLKNYHDAIKFFEKAIITFPKKWIFWFNMGQAYLELKDTEEAIHIFRKAYKLKPENPIVLQFLGNSYSESGDYKSAIRCYKKAVNIFPEFGNAWIELGKVYGKIENYQQAKKALEKAKELRPENSEIENLINEYKNY